MKKLSIFISMKGMIRKMLREDFDWVTNDTVSFLEIGEPLSTQSPKNAYRLHMTHGVGEEYGTHIPNWIDFNTDDLDRLTRFIKILNYLNLNHADGLDGLVDLWVKGGQTWVLSDDTNKEITYDKELGMWFIDNTEFDKDEITYQIEEWLREELLDYGIIDIDTYHQEDASVEDWKVTYFDEFGVEHVVKVNL